jgi:hypothetical protein
LGTHGWPMILVAVRRHPHAMDVMVSRRPPWKRSSQRRFRPAPIVLILIVCVPGVLSQTASARAQAFARVSANGQCSIDDKIVVRCGQLGERLNSMHVDTGHHNIVLWIEGAPYDAVETAIDSLNAKGYEDVVAVSDVGTVPSPAVTHWIKLLVFGNVNHPSPMITISPHFLRTFSIGEFWLTLPQAHYDLVESVTKERMARGDCVKDPKQFNWDEHAVRMVEQENQVTRSCILPSPATSCDFLSSIVTLSQVNWSETDLEHIRMFADEIERCNRVGTDGDRRRATP